MHVARVPMWVFVISTKHFLRSTEHFTTWFCLHSTPTSRHFTFRQSGFFRLHNLSTRHLAFRKVFFSFGRKSINCHKDFTQTTPMSGKYSHSCSIIFFSVVDHATRLELSNKSNCNFFHRWHMSELAM